MAESNTSLHLSYGKLVPHSSTNNSTSYIFTYAYEAAPQIKKAGDLFIVIELIGEHKIAQQLCEVTAQNFGELYYNQENKHQDTFEQAIRTINKQLRNSEPAEESLISSMSAIIAVAKQDSISFARAGNANCLFLRNKKLHNVFTSSEHGTKKIAGFTQLASGELKLKDRFLLCTPAILTEVDESEIGSSLNQESTSSIISALASKLNPTIARRSGAFAIIVDDKKQIIHQPNNVKNSTLVTGSKYSIRDNIANKTKQSALKLLGFARNFILRSLRRLKQSSFPKLKQRSKHAWNKLWTSYINKNPRLAAIIAIFVIATLIGASFIILRPQSTTKNEILLYKQSADEYARAQAKLAEGDQAEAEKLVTSAANSAQQLNTTSNDKLKLNQQINKDDSIKEKIPLDQLIKKINALQDKITLTVRPQENSLYTINDNVSFKNIELIGNKIYSIASDKKVYSFDIVSLSKTSFDTTIAADEIISTTADPSKNIIYVLTKTPAVWKIDINSKKSSAVSLSSGEWQASRDIDFYNNNLYLLSTNNKQIYKHTPTSAGFGPAANYLKQPDQDLENSNSMAVNGVIVASSKTGFLQFNVGQSQPFELDKVPQNIGSAYALSLNAKNTILAGINEKMNRLFIINLQSIKATFKTQYAISGSIADFALSSDLKRAYIVSNNQLISIDLN